MDNGTEFIIETAGRGVVVNFRSFLLEDTLNLTARCHTTVTMQVIDKFYFQKIVAKDRKLVDRINKDLINYVDEGKYFQLDITPFKPILKTFDKNVKKGQYVGDEAERAQRVNILFKNTVIKFLL